MSSVATAKKLMTAAEFFDFVHRPENANRWFELVRGEVIELPPPQTIHGVVCVNVGAALKQYRRQVGVGYVTGNDSGVILRYDPDTVRGPDVAYYGGVHSRDELPPKYGEVAPVLAVEVMSPSDRPTRIVGKVFDYLRNGVALVWLIDPEDSTVSVYRPDRDSVTLGLGATLSGEDVLPGLALPVAELFEP